MRNTTSLFLTLISYFIMLGTILALLFAAMPSLKAQTNQSVETNPSSAVAATNSSAADTNLLQKNEPVRIDDSGVHIGGANPVNVQFPHGKEGLGLGQTMVALMPFVFPVAILAVIFYFKHRRNKLAHETLRLMIEKGVPVTSELVASLKGKDETNDNREKSKTAYLLTGLILLGIGIGVMVIAGKPGLIVLFIGVAFLIVWLVERKRNGAEQHTGSITKQGIQIVEGKQNSAEQSPKP